MLETIRREQRARRLRLMLLWPAIAVSAAILLLVLIGYQVGHPTIVGRLAKVGLIDRSTAIAQITKGYLDGRVSDTPAIEALSNIDPGWARSTEVARNIDQFLLRYHAHWPSAVTGTRSGGEIPRAVLGGSPPASLLVFVRPGPVSATPDISGASAAALAGLHLGWVTTEASAAERRRVIHELLRVVAHRDSPAAIAALRLLRDLPRDVPADEVLFAAVSSRKPAVLREGTVTLHALDRAWWVRSDLPSAYVTEALRHASADALRQSEVDWARVPRSAVQAYFRLVTAAHTPRGALGLHTTNLQQAFEPIKREIGVAICKGPLMDRQMVELCALERQARQAVRR